jgi:hypothetical protein
MVVRRKITESGFLDSEVIRVPLAAMIIFAEMIRRKEPEWQRNKDAKKWDDWEKYEEMRENLGHAVDIERIPRRHKPRKKHHY